MSLSDQRDTDVTIEKSVDMQSGDKSKEPT